MQVLYCADTAGHPDGPAQRQRRRHRGGPPLRRERPAPDRPCADRRQAPRRQARRASPCASAAAWARPASSRCCEARRAACSAARCRAADACAARTSTQCDGACAPLMKDPPLMSLTHAPHARLPAPRLARRGIAAAARALCRPLGARPSPRCSTPASASRARSSRPSTAWPTPQEPHFDGERVHLPEATHAAMAAYAESGMLAAAQDYDVGGMQLPCVDRDGGQCLLQQGQRRPWAATPCSPAATPAC